MAAVVVDLAEAIVVALNGATFSQTFTATRSYLPVFELPELQTLQVTVVPESQGVESAARELYQWECAFDVGVQKRVDPNALSEVDDLLLLVEEIGEFLASLRPEAAGIQAAQMTVENEPTYAVEHLDQHRVFTSVLTVTYRVVRAV